MKNKIHATPASKYLLPQMDTVSTLISATSRQKWANIHESATVLKPSGRFPPLAGRRQTTFSSDEFHHTTSLARPVGWRPHEPSFAPPCSVAHADVTKTGIARFTAQIFPPPDFLLLTASLLLQQGNLLDRVCSRGVD